jgi:hypothetical protein
MLLTAVSCLVLLDAAACSKDPPSEPAFEPLAAGDVSDALDCEWKEMDIGDSFDWPVEPSAAGICQFTDGESVDMALFDQAGGASAYAAIIPCLFNDYPTGNYYFAVGAAWVASGGDLNRQPAERALDGLDGELVHVTQLGGGPACDDG